MIAIAGDDLLGGQDIDNLLIDKIKKKFTDERGKDLFDVVNRKYNKNPTKRADKIPKTKAKLKQIANNAKLAFSTDASSTEISLGLDDDSEE